jgi:hypothetical protein
MAPKKLPIAASGTRSIAPFSMASWKKPQGVTVQHKQKKLENNHIALHQHLQNYITLLEEIEIPRTTSMAIASPRSAATSG